MVELDEEDDRLSDEIKMERGNHKEVMEIKILTGELLVISIDSYAKNLYSKYRNVHDTCHFKQTLMLACLYL